MSDKRRFAIAGLTGILLSALSVLPIGGGAYLLWPGSLLIDGFFPDPHTQFIWMMPLAFAVDWGIWTLIVSILLMVVKKRAA